MTQAIVQHTGISALATGPSVLGETQAKIPVGGKIRAGIKVLTKDATNEKSQTIYKAGVEAGKPWGVIEKELIDACGFTKSPLTPKNVGYFTARPSDFIIHENAGTILEKYGSNGPDGFRIYRFPIIFPTDQWITVMPHALNCYTRSERVYWSEYAPDGTRHCVMHAPVPIDERSKRAIRTFGGRAVIPRPDNGGICVPDKCPEYQARKCNLTGSFLFYIPGIPGLAAVSLATTSFYSMQQAREKIEMVAFIRGGKISGTVDGRAIFYITKNLREVSMIDPETGKPKRVKQYLIELEADIDVSRLFQQGEARVALESGAKAAAALEAPAVVDPDETGEGDDPPEPPAPAEPTPEEVERAKAKALRASVYAKLQALDLNIDHFSRYGIAMFGDDWSSKSATLTRADDLLKNAAEDPKVLAAIKTWELQE